MQESSPTAFVWPRAAWIAAMISDPARAYPSSDWTVLTANVSRSPRRLAGKA
jgi:hypothetical protein